MPLPFSSITNKFYFYIQFYVSAHLADDLNQNESKINTPVDTHYT